MKKEKIIARYIVAYKDVDLYNFDIIENEDAHLSWRSNIPKEILDNEMFKIHLTLLTGNELIPEERDKVAIMLFQKVTPYVWDGNKSLLDKPINDSWKGKITTHWFFDLDAKLEARKYKPTTHEK